jgi:spermidine synthase
MTSPDGAAAANSSRLRMAVVAIFILSGAAGLIYEIVWARQLVLVFGNTTQAVSAILTGFFAGLAIGSVVGGRFADRVPRSLRLYGLIELALGAVALLTPILFRLIHEVYRAAYGSLEETPTTLTLVRFGLAMLALAPATILMGASLPTLSRYLARRSSELGGTFGRLYTANTVGALVGTLAAGFVLIELLGLAATLWVGVACSWTAGVAALVLDRRHRVAPPVGVPPPPVEQPAATVVDGSRPVTSGLLRLALAVAFVSGLTSLGYQVLWTRLLSSGTGNSTYVFTTILAMFLFGIAVGAAIVSARPPRPAEVLPTIGFVQALIGGLALVGVVIIGGVLVELDFTALTMIVVLPATMAIGLALPLSAHLVGSTDERVGRDTGRLLAVNTTGVIVATVGIPFLVIPTIGSPAATVLLGLINLALGIGVLSWQIVSRRTDGRATVTWVATTLAVTTAAVIVLPLAVDPSLARLQRDGELWGHSEDEIASVQAGELGGHAHLLVAGTGMTTLTVDSRLMPVLPTIARPDSDSLLVIAFGMGSSYRTGLILGHEVTGVELVPSVPRFFDRFFPDADDVLADPAGHLVLTDGRNHVELTDRTYDIAMADPPPPIKSSGTGVLYSREFYAAICEHLNPGGVMMQWIPFDETVEDFRAHVRTFHDVFANVVLARGPGGYGIYMLGSADPIRLEPSTARAVLARPGVLADISGAFDSPADSIDAWLDVLEDIVLASGDEVDAIAGTGTLITDDRPLTEYFLLRRLFGPPTTPMRPDTVTAAQ